VEPGRLPRLHPGSWINHDYNVWIGHPEDNRAWDLLYAARELLAITDPSVPNYELAQKEIYISLKVQTGAGGSAMTMKVPIMTNSTSCIVPI
jgi:alpha-amylase/alpha-mannosidase (GH57 family)